MAWPLGRREARPRRRGADLATEADKQGDAASRIIEAGFLRPGDDDIAAANAAFHGERLSCHPAQDTSGRDGTRCAPPPSYRRGS